MACHGDVFHVRDYAVRDKSAQTEMYDNNLTSGFPVINSRSKHRALFDDLIDSNPRRVMPPLR